MNLTDEQLSDLTKRMNKRRDELGPEGRPVLARLSPGEVRMAVDVFDQWGQDQDYEVVEEYANAREQAYDNGYDAGYLDAKRVYTLAFGDGKTAPPPHNIDPHFGITVDELLNGHRGDPGPHLAAPDAYPDGAPRAKLDFDHVVEEAARQQEEAAWDWEDSTANIDALSKPEPEPSPISDAAAATLGPEHTVVTPLSKPVHGGRFLTLPHPDEARANVAALVAAGGAAFDFTPKPMGAKPKRHVAGKRGNVLPPLEELIAEVKRQAVGTHDMPTMAMFDVAKPVNWATAPAHLKRLEITWEDLAIAAGLTPRRPGPHPGRVARNVAEAA